MLQNYPRSASHNQSNMRQKFLSKQQQGIRSSFNVENRKKGELELKDFREKKLYRQINHKAKRSINFPKRLYPTVYPIDNGNEVQIFKEIKLCKIPKWDLTWTLANININNTALNILFIILILVRYMTISFAIYLAVSMGFIIWEIFLLIFITSGLYWLSLVKVSLKTAEKNTEIILNRHFDSLSDIQKGIFFRKVQKSKLIMTMVKGIIPPEFSFLYIGRLQTPRRKKNYLILNFIYCSIEAIIYIPGYLISFYLRQINYVGLQKIDLGIAICLIVSWFLFALLCIILVCKSRNQYVPVD